MSGARTSSSTERPFFFTPLKMTGIVSFNILFENNNSRNNALLDDDAYLCNDHSKTIGEIAVEVWTCEYSLITSGPDPAPEVSFSETVVHERAKKAVAHRIGYDILTTQVHC
jgi:hypothetical protein